LLSLNYFLEKWRGALGNVFVFLNFAAMCLIAVRTDGWPTLILFAMCPARPPAMAGALAHSKGLVIELHPLNCASADLVHI